jgi:hypothetical protein
VTINALVYRGAGGGAGVTGKTASGDLIGAGLGPCGALIADCTTRSAAWCVLYKA